MGDFISDRLKIKPNKFSVVAPLPGSRIYVHPDFHHTSLRDRFKSDTSPFTYLYNKRTGVLLATMGCTGYLKEWLIATVNPA